jgi:hypothetical protein
LKKLAIAVILLIIFLAIFIPFASSNPDGLEKIVSTFGAQERQNFWTGLITNYSFSWISNQYISTLLAGVSGIVLVLAAGLVLDKTMGFKTAKEQKN